VCSSDLVVMSVQNDAAKLEKFLIPKKFRVPPESVIFRQFEAGEEPVKCYAEEDLSWWESKGEPLPDRPIVVEARKVADRVFAIIQPTEPVRSTRRRTPQQKTSKLSKRT
jgi:hypothetical protein